MDESMQNFVIFSAINRESYFHFLECQKSFNNIWCVPCSCLIICVGPCVISRMCILCNYNIIIIASIKCVEWYNKRTNYIPVPLFAKVQASFQFIFVCFFFLFVLLCIPRKTNKSGITFFLYRWTLCCSLFLLRFQMNLRISKFFVFLRRVQSSHTHNFCHLL